MSRVEVLADLFRERPLVWIDGRELEIAGRYAWRTRISDLRRLPFNMTIDNRQRRVGRPDGTHYVVSEYRFVPVGIPARPETEDTNSGVAVAAPPLLF